LVEPTEIAREIDTRRCVGKRASQEATMLNAEQLQSLSQLTPPVLTAYLDTKPVSASSGGPASAYIPWLKKEAKIATRSLRPGEQELFKAQVARVEEFLHDRTPREKGLIILAGPKTWELLPLKRQVENELRWGRPALSQLFWLLSENKPHCLVVVDRTGARFFRYWFGDMTELGQMEFVIDISQWKKKELGHVAGQGVQKTRGTQRDTHRHRMDAQFARLYREAAERTKNLCEKDGCTAVFLVGSDRLIKPIAAEFPKQFPHPVIAIEEDFGSLSLPELRKRLGSRITRWENDHQLAMIDALLAEQRRAVVGFDETLALFQERKLRTLIVTRELNQSLHKCSECDWMDRSADPACPRCRRERFAVNLRDVLPELSWRTKTLVDVVGGKAAEHLNEAGGMGGWLRDRTQAQLR
jgi:release factor family 10